MKMTAPTKKWVSVAALLFSWRNHHHANAFSNPVTPPCIPLTRLHMTLSQDQGTNDVGDSIHTLLLCRHGDSIWNGGEPGTRETFTGWTNVPLSAKGIQEAQETGRLVSEFEGGIDVCCTSILQRAQMTAHYCLWGFSDKPNVLSPRKYIQDYRLNERHYGALQGLVKEDVENGMYGHDPTLVQQWRRSWYTVPPLLEDDGTDERRIEELKTYLHACGGSPQDVPRGESLDQVAEYRIRPFLSETLMPILQEATVQRTEKMMEQGKVSSLSDEEASSWGGTGLVVAHANSLRAMIGVLCRAKENPKALARLEALRLQTGVPLVLRFRMIPSDDESTDEMEYQACNLEGQTVENSSELPVYPLSALPRSRIRPSLSIDSNTRTGGKPLTVPF